LGRLREGGARAIIIRWGVDQYTAPNRVNVLAIHCHAFTFGKQVRGTREVLSSTLPKFGRVGFL
jgi:hypothetical protein